MRQGVQLQEPAPKPQTSPTGYLLPIWQKTGLLILLLGLLYLRLFRKRQARRKLCSHCNEKNPTHLTNCAKCGAPLF
jgi:ribosomal protein L40E